MKGLLRKDLYLLAGVGKSYAVILLLYLALTISGVVDISFLLTMLQILLCMYPSTSFACDDQVKWDLFAVSLPNGRTQVVRAKYGLTLVLATAALAANVVLSLLAAALDLAPLNQSLLVCMGGVLTALLLNALLLPLIFRFGAQKGRLMLMGIASGTIAILGAALSLAKPSADLIAGAPIPFLLSLVLGALALSVSYRISLRIYGKKEF